ncbi:MAG: UDP-N-acetylmuramoylalanyl-D-glutamyl-2, 6-diaminopimelate--D-alanyl-D-alanine ligase [Candidatus Microthrix sp.]|jgi:UDP-N-acetylmuramoyl-tripeptide--D-alanyl-D-alanine ligase|nr:UDP-N-acetylmuramoylalanyl-D-glutamyl-2, 6-diaminopimelate--D-alanyl-D-alanine ligase [Candidatus Microthrix sp.]
MRLLTSEIADAVGGVHEGPALPVEQYRYDHRELGTSPDELFVAGYHRFLRDDTNRHTPRAVSADRPYLCEVAPVGGTAIVVAEVEPAMLALGRHVRPRLTDRCIGITGSVGKTTVKQLIAAAAATTYRTHATPRSFNTKFSMPGVLASAPLDTECLVVELSAKHRGDVRIMAEVARPSVGVVTKLGWAHQAMMMGQEGIAATKGELVEALPSNGTAVLSTDDPMVEGYADRTQAAVLTYGSTGDVRATRVDLADDLSMRVAVSTPWGDAELHPPLRGAHHAINLLAALAGALAGGVSLEMAVSGIEAATLPDHRMNMHRIAGDITVIDDSFNGTLESVLGALDALAALDAPERVAVLGPLHDGMAYIAEIHATARARAEALGVEILAFRAPEYRLPVVEHRRQLRARVEALPAGSAVLIKGSRDNAIDEAVAELLSEPASRGAT